MDAVRAYHAELNLRPDDEDDDVARIVLVESIKAIDRRREEAERG
jgi:hypothetical protein